MRETSPVIARSESGEAISEIASLTAFARNDMERCGTRNDNEERA